MAAVLLDVSTGVTAGLVLVAGAFILTACGPTPSTGAPTQTPIAPPQAPVAAEPSEEASAGVDEPAPPASAVLVLPRGSDEDWRPALPQVNLEVGSVDERARDACVDRHGLSAPDDATAATLLAGATCVGESGAIGMEVALLRRLVRDHPNATQSSEAYIRIGLRLEQIGDTYDAFGAYRSFVERYPKSPDALVLGKRGLCLALALGSDELDVLADKMMRNYRRKAGFTRPPEPELRALCGLEATKPS